MKEYTRLNLAQDVYKDWKVPVKKKPVILKSGRMACTPEYEREEIEWRERFNRERVK